MKDFFKMFFASILGVITAGIILICISVFILSGIVASFAAPDKPAKISDNSILKVDMKSLSEIVTSDPLDIFRGSGADKTLSLTEVISSINKAKNNPNIKGIYLNTEELSSGMASVDEVRKALLDFKKSGKFIISYADNFSQKSYYLSSVADKIVLNPQGKIMLLGISAPTIFYKNALDKIGVEMMTFKVGTYKGAVEPGIRNELSEANKLQISEYINGLWNNITQGIADSRKKSVQDIKAFADSGYAVRESKIFVEKGLADTLAYRYDVEKMLRSKLKIKEKDDINWVSLAQMNEQQSAKQSGEKIKVIYAEGAIMPQEVSSYNNSQTINYSLAKQLHKLAKDDDIKAVVLRVNSPGGSAFLSEQIWKEVIELKKKKPIVVSMGDVAASGGYYISCAANEIIAENNTLTGSIGIFGQFPNATALAKKIGLNVDVVKTSKYSDMLLSGNVAGLIKPLSEDEKALIQAEIERGYDTFISRVAEGRKMTKEQVNEIAQGRVWLGNKAKEIGLVDKIGGLDTAIKRAAALANLSSYKVIYGTTSKNFLSELFSSTAEEFHARISGKFLSREEIKLLQEYRQRESLTGYQARLPYEISAY
ncbi:signal peptide peptidase SppA [Porphyromonas pogonae]|uniref:signal peptide peptidase SppA n=1 Tax=Porphyromonas pogonae TaxID=867595 RepID=UPI002E7930F8|nr:signal peptide peptidase SppA [Porphyromonas pogonae]